MPVLWFPEQDGTWSAQALDACSCWLIAGTPPRIVPAAVADAPAGASPTGSGDARLQATRNGVHEQWVLVAARAAEVSINGQPLRLGVAVLRERDEVYLPGGRIGIDGAGSAAEGMPRRCFFSAESLARIESFPGGDKPTFCPRCKKLIDPQVPAVRCPAPSCRLWHHQTEARPCWTYAETCAVCDQPTALDAGYRWTPHQL
jgi:hypothetical protein